MDEKTTSTEIVQHEKTEVAPNKNNNKVTDYSLGILELPTTLSWQCRWQKRCQNLLWCQENTRGMKVTA